jgi:membrane-associated PAP2 superfamily phosphatase
MPIWLKTLLLLIVFTIAILVAYNLLRKYMLSKIKANKWVVLVVAAIVFFIPIISMFTRIDLPWNIIQYISSAIVIILLLWFMDLAGFSRRRYETVNKKNEIIMKPKAKPNRVKNK